MVQQRFQAPRYKMVKLWHSSKNLKREKTFLSVLCLEINVLEKDRNILQQDYFHQQYLEQVGELLKLWAKESDGYMEDGS